MRVSFPSSRNGPQEHSPHRHNASQNHHNHPIRYKPDKKSNWKRQQPKQHGPAPLRSCQCYGPECLAAFEDDKDLACNNYSLDEKEAIVVGNSVEEVPAVVDSSGTISDLFVSYGDFNAGKMGVTHFNILKNCIQTYILKVIVCT